MGEGKRKRIAKRRRAVFRGTQKSCSDSEVAQSKFKDRKSKRDLLPWPKAIETLTVDELALHRRRRVQDILKDTLDPYYHGESDSAVENLITEYRRAFRAFSEDSLLLRDNYLRNFERNLQTKTSAELSTSTEVNKPDDKSMESNTGLLSITGHASRPQPIRRGTSLRRGGEFYSDTESSTNYKTYEGIHRAELARRPTSLKMEGDMQTVTEQCEKFTGWMNVGRPELARIPTHLKMEGRLETSTESHDQYVPFIGARRPEILRQNAHLKLEGESNFIPEYTDVFRPHVRHEKRYPMFPESHLKTGGDFSGHTENFQNFVDPRGAVPIDDRHKDSDTEDTENQIKHQNDNQRTEEDMKMIVSKLEHLKGPPLEVPEYKDAYKDFPRERPKLLKPEDEIGRADGSKVHLSSSSGKFSTKIDQDPEYKSKYLDRDRPVYRKPPMSRRPSGGSNFGKRLVPDMRHYVPTSEVRSQYVPYGHVPRVETFRRPISLRPEGSMNLQPEYRDAYCRKKDHPVVESRYRNRDRSYSGSRRRSSNWMNYNNDNNNNNLNDHTIDQTEMIDSGQNAFQILHSKAEHDNLAGKPPAGSRRSSILSQAVRPTHLDIMSPSAVKNRSPSPTYRLHVCNVDDETRGFNRRRQLASMHQSSPMADATADEDNIRPYSPSFGKQPKPNNNGNRAFVVLDDSMNNQATSETRRTRFNNNSNNEMSRDPKIRYRNKTPPNWMPPWYDNTSTI
ncbi:uncharacterized protein [Chelonus insularis]|uniref:uncharacterized protein n=1 Tax=Chelonus insularis TaxID=460826 RepID=UPI00158AB3E8|nr:uncharacterized protein LOC118071684 [Chelonus insularis]XP_034946886.1 uncharacterized protein LOC118071684 [Chelonus insularis]